MQAVFLFCNGDRNTVVARRGGTPGEHSLDLLIDGAHERVIDLDDALGQPALLGVNLIADATFAGESPCWKPVAEDPGGISIGVDFSEEWRIQNGHTLYVFQGADQETAIDLLYCDPVFGEFLPVAVANTYQLGGRFGLHRCTALFNVAFYDAQHALLASREIAVPNDKLGGKPVDSYALLRAELKPPPRAAFVSLTLRKMPTRAGEKDSFLFFAQPAFTVVRTPRPNAASEPAYAWEASPLGTAEWDLLRGVPLRESLGHEFALPDHVYDGRVHTIALVDRASGEPLPGSPRSFVYHDDVSGGLHGLQGSAVAGWVSSPKPVVELYVDDRFAGSTTPGASAGSRHEFRLAVPPQFLDGRAHRIEVRLRPTGRSLGELAELTPFMLTPWNALQEHAGKPLPGKLSPAAAYRYDALRAALLAFSDEHAGGEPLAAARVAQVARLGWLHDRLTQGFASARGFEPLEFPTVAEPLASIVVPVHNKFAVTYNCLVALLFAYNRASFEVIIVDDGSSDETLDLPELVAGVKYLRNETAQGFVRSCNRGAAVARGKYIVMLNNDTEPTVNWLDELLFVFDNFERVGMAGSKLLYPDGSLQEAGGIVWKNGNPWNYGRSANPHDPRFNYTRQVDYLSGAAIMVPMALWNEIGGFSDEFAPAYFEDTDLAFKVRAAGYKTVYAPLSVVYHFEGISSGTSVASGMKRFQEVNRPKFKQKWIDACRHNGEEGVDVDLNKDRGVIYRALVIDYQTPRSDMDAGSYAAIQEMRLLQSLGFKVTFVPENMAYMGRYTEELQRMGVEVLIAPFASSVHEVLQKRGEEFDVVYMTRYYVARNHLAAVRQFAPRAKTLFCNADLHFLRELRDAVARKDPDGIKRACDVREQELSIMRDMDVSLSYNPIEHAVVLSHNLDQTRVVTCPWVVDLTATAPGFDERTDIAFLGGFGHPPNREAVLFFVNQVMPLLRRQLPEARFRIYGSNIPADIEALAGDDVIVHGHVEDVAEVYDGCRVFVAPLLTGAGIKGKVIDALAHGLPAVLSAIAVEGTALRDGLEALIAEMPQDWADAVTRLYTEKALWESMRAAGRAFATAQYSFANGRKTMLKALHAADIFAPLENQALVVGCARPQLRPPLRRPAARVAPRASKARR